jgi:hypothetical protein
MSDKTPPYSEVYLGGDSIRLAKTGEGRLDSEDVTLERAPTLPLGTGEHSMAAPDPMSEQAATGALFFGPHAPPSQHGMAPMKVTTAGPPRPSWTRTGSVVAFLIALSATAVYFALEPGSSTSVPIALPTEPAKTVALPTHAYPPMRVAPPPTRTAAPIPEATDAIAAVAPPAKVGASFPAPPAERKVREVDAPRRQEAIAFPAARASAVPVSTTRKSPVSSSDSNPFPAGTSHF